MANTYTQCLFHLVFAVKNREALIRPDWKDKLEKYITGIVQTNNHKLIAIYAMPDHLHLLIGYNVNQLIPKLVEEIKTSSNAWIRENNFSASHFEWQKGYGAFTHAKSQTDFVVKYILSQKEHHTRQSFREEYLNVLKKNEVVYDDLYLFDFFDKH